MIAQQERILVVEGDHSVSDLISRQTLKPLGFRVKVIRDAPMALQEVKTFLPDIMIVNLDLPGLSGKDLLVALSSQGVDLPVIVIASEGMEWDVIQAFRLGATDYLGWPIREAEIVSAVERSLVQVRVNRDRETLTRKVEKTTKELQARVRELTTIVRVGKSITAITDRQTLLEKIIEGAVYIAEADKGWLLLRGHGESEFNLFAQKNLPKSIASRLDSPWDDGISSLVAISGESLSIHGPPLKLLKISRLCRSALIAPIIVNKETVGLVAVARDVPKPFSATKRTLIEALADYSSIALVNSELFEDIENRALSLMGAAESSQKSEKVRADVLSKLSEELDTALSEISHEVEFVTGDRNNPITEQQAESMRFINERIQRAKIAVDGLHFMYDAQKSKNMVAVSIGDLTRQAASRFQDLADEKSVNFVLDVPDEPIFVMADVDQIGQVFDSLLTNAIWVSSGSDVEVCLRQDKVGSPHVTIRDSGPGIPEDTIPKVFDPFFALEQYKTEDQDHIGVSLALVNEMLKAHGGKMWVESRLDVGSIFHFTLKLAV